MNNADLQNNSPELSSPEPSITVNSIDYKSGKKSLSKKIILIACLLLALLVGIWYFTGSSSSNKKQAAESPKDRTVPVTVATAQSQVVPVEIHSIGNVLAYSVVNVVPQVGGQLLDVYFKQGHFVKKGDLLFQIDPSPYKAALAQAEGNVARDKAQVLQAQANVEKDEAQVEQLRSTMIKDQSLAKYAKAQNSRYSMLVTEGAVSEEQSDQVATNLAGAQATIQGDLMAIKNAQSIVAGDKAAIQTARGTLAADQAAAQTARIQLGWTQIRSPLDGKTGSLNVYQGNVVTANTNTPLVSITQVQPIYVTFTVPEQYLDQVRAALHKHNLGVEALIGGAKAAPLKGAVSFLENSVNTSTGTVVMRAAFANEEKRLFPGQFVDVIVTIPTDEPSIVVPNTALQTTQKGTAVFVVKPDKTVTLNPVKLQRTTADLAAISSGIAAGDLVVTDGQLQLAPGSRVKIVDGIK